MEQMMRLPNIDIACVGTVVIDLLGSEPDTPLSEVTGFRRSIGGATVNVAATATRLGRRAAVVGRIGDEAFGTFARSELRRLSIVDSWIQVDPQEATTLAFSARHAGKIDLLVVRGADRNLELPPPTRSMIENAAAVHTTTFALAVEPIRTAVIEALEIAHAAGKIVSLDPNYRTRNWNSVDNLMPLLRHLLPLTTLIKPSLLDAEEIWGAGHSPGYYIDRFHEHGARQVLLTLGREGVLVSDGQEVTRLPATPVATDDTAGIGDVFTAAAITALIDGYSLLTAARIGMLVATYRLHAMDHAAPLPAWRVLVEQARDEDEPTAALVTSPRPTSRG
jgi:sugar/nucleoside kinase (ribokinase family)